MDRTDDGVAGGNHLAVGHPDPTRPTRTDDDLDDLGVEPDLAAIGLDGAHERVGQTARSADGLGDAERVDDAGHEVDAHAGTELVGKLQVLGHQLQEVDFDVVALERIVDDVERRAAHDVEDFAALVGGIEHCHERTERQRRRVQAR